MEAVLATIMETTSAASVAAVPAMLLVVNPIAATVASPAPALTHAAAAFLTPASMERLEWVTCLREAAMSMKTGMAALEATTKAQATTRASVSQAYLKMEQLELLAKSSLMKRPP